MFDTYFERQLHVDQKKIPTFNINLKNIGVITGNDKKKSSE